MNKRMTTFIGVGLLFLGGVALFNATILNWIGFGLWRFWPLTVMAVGVGLVAAPFMSGKPRQLAPLFIPGLPILMSSLLLLWGSLFNWWDVWQYFWPTVVMAFAFGFAATALFMRVIWFLIPAILFGLPALVFQFTALTGWWPAWAVLWPVFPLSLGLALLVVGQLNRTSGLILSGTIFVGLAGFSFALMAIVMSGVLGVLGAVLLIGSGGVLVMRGLLVGERPLTLDDNDTPEKLPKSVG